VNIIYQLKSLSYIYQLKEKEKTSKKWVAIEPNSDLVFSTRNRYADLKTPYMRVWIWILNLT